MFRNLLDVIDTLLRAQKTPLVPVKTETIDVMSLERRLLYSAVPLLEPPQNVSQADVDLLSSESSEFASPDDSDSSSASQATEAEVNLTTIANESEDSTTQLRRELIFIDSGVEDFEQLLAEALANTDSKRELEIVLLSPERDGVEHISQILAQRSNLDAVHIVSHGSAGRVQLGNVELNSQSLAGYAGQIASWSSALNTHADFLFYGCDLANGDGKDLLESLAALTDADVAASDDLTGHADLGGDWVFEIHVGSIETELAVSITAQADWQHLLDLTGAGGETRINSVTTNSQITTPNGGGNVAMDASGNYVAAWQDGRSGDNDIWAAVYNADGTVKVSEFKVHTNQATSQESANVAMAANGNFAVTWSDNRSGTLETYMRLFNSTGTAITGETLVSGMAGAENYHALDFAADGSFVVTFQSSSDTDIYFQRYNASGVAQGGNVKANSFTTSTQNNPEIAVADNGTFVIVWESNSQDGAGYGVYGQRFNADGTTNGSEFLVNTSTSNDQYYASVAAANDGSFVVSWSDKSMDGDKHGIYAQRYNAVGVAQGTEFLVNTTTSDEQYYSQIDLNANGDFIITWTSKNQDGGMHGIYAQQFDKFGTRIGGEVRVNSTTSGEQLDSSVAFAGTQAVVVWSGNGSGDASGIFAQRFSAMNTLTKMIASASDDAEEEGPTGTTPNRMWLNSSDIELVSDFESPTAGAQKIGLRFTGMNIPVGATITNAYLVFRAIPADSGMTNSDSTNLTVKGQLTGNAATFTTTSGNISGRATTAASTAWSPTAWTTGLDYSSPDISSVIQEIVNQGSWASGNALALIITGTGHRASQAYDSNPSNAAQLVVTYTTAPTNTAPTISLPGAALNYTEYAPATIIDSTATANDADSANLDSGSLTVDFSANGTANDRLAIRNQGSLPGQIGVSGANVTYGGVNIGTYSGGTGTTPLVITFNASSSPAAAQALMQNITYENVADDPSTAARTVRFVLTDGDGGTSAAATKTINLFGDNILYVTTANDTLDAPVATSINSLLANRGGDGLISLREAILAVNGTANLNGSTPDVIRFKIGAGGAQTITVNGTSGANPNGTGYDFIVDPVIIDATTQSGYAGTPLITLDGSSATGTSGALVMRTNDSTIKGFIVTGFNDEGIEVDGSTGFGDNNIVEYNWVGINAASGAAGNFGDGILISENADNNIVRFNVVGANGFGAAGDDGIVIRNTDSHNNWVYGNLVGLAADGTTIRANARHGVAVYSAGTSNLIGSNGDGSNDVLERNIISGNSTNGVWVSSTNGTVIRGNYIGANSAGTVIRGNSGYGIEIDNSSSVVIDGNLISGNTLGGISLWNTGTTLATVTSNYIGTNAAGTAALGNTNDGIKIGGGANNNTIGGDRTAGKGNVISGNTGTNSDAIEIGGSGANNNKIYGNFLGTNATGTAAIGNARYGVVVYNGAQGTEIGGTGTGQGNIISGNTSYGIIVDGNNGNTTTGTMIAANTIGLNLAGTSAIANGGSGIRLIAGARNTTIGGTTAAHRNLISGNTGDGIVVTGSTTQNNTISGNYIGTDITGNVAAANTQAGINIANGSTGNIIGGTTAGERNIISGNATYGINITDAGTSNNTVAGNYIGLGADGDTIVANQSYGITINNGAGGNTIGGLTSASRNVISGNAGAGIYIASTSNGNQIFSNYVGTNAAGTAARANQNGIYLDGSSSTIIGQSGAGNLISGNTYSGIVIDASSATGNTIRANLIGTDAAGTANLGNQSHGIQISNGAFSNIIGGTTAGDGNTIAFNANDGISVTSAAAGNRYLGNVIHSNSGIGIDYANDGATPNGSGLQNFPVLTSATVGASTTIVGTLTSTASRTFRVEFFANSSGEPGTHGQGRRYLGFVNVTTNGSGVGTFSPTLASAVVAGEKISATATDLTTITTSEFGQNIIANTAPTLDSSKSPVLTSQNEDSGAPSGMVGTLVSSLVDFASPTGQVDNVTDPDSGAMLGIAVTATNTTNGTWWYSTNNGSNWLALGAVTNSTARLLAADANTRIYFEPNANYNGTIADAITFRAWDRISGSNGGTVDTSTNGGATAYSSVSDTASLVINAVNDQPVFTSLNGAPTFTEGGSAVVLDSDVMMFDAELSAANNFNVATLTLVRNGGANAQDVFSATGTLSALTQGGSLVVGGTTVGTVTTNSSGTLVLTFNANATNALVNSVMQQIAYSNNSDTPPASAQINWTFNDGNTGAQGSGSALTATGNVTVNITAVNDAPTLTAMSSPVVTVNEDTQATITFADLLAAGNEADVDGTVTAFVVKTVSSGTLLIGTSAGTATAWAAGTNDTIDATRQAYWTGALDSNGTLNSFTVVAKDDGGLESTTPVQVQISATPVNDAPIRTAGSVNNLTVLEDSGFTSLGFGSLAYGPGGGVDESGQTLTYNVTAVPTGLGSVYLADGTTLVTTSSVLTLTELRGLQFRTTTNSTGTSGFQFNPTDSGGTANGGSDNFSEFVLITVTQVNDAPTLNASALNPTFTEAAGLGTQAAAVNVFGSAAVSTIEAGQRITGLTFTISGLLDGSNEVIVVDGRTITLGANSSGTTVTNGLAYSSTVSGGTATIVLSGGSLTTAATQTMVNNVTYQNTNTDDPAAGNRVVTLTQIKDNGGTTNGGSDTTTLSIASTVAVNSVNDQAAFTALNGTPAFTEGGSAVVFDSDATIFDAELSAANNFSGATLTLVRNGGANSQDVYSATGTLSALTQGGSLVVGGTTIGTVTTNSAGTLVLTFNANATNALVNSAMQQIAYSNSSDAPPASVQIDWNFNDGNSGSQGSGGALPATGSTTVSITSVNDEQVLATNAGRTVNENSTGNAISNTQLLTTDVDNTTSQLVYTITTATSNGTLRRSGIALSVSSTFTQADINAGLITYDHNGSETSSDSFSFSVDDGAGSASTGTFNITVTPVNDNNPVITSNGGGATAAINVAENSTAVTTVTATDGDLPGQTLTYSISGIDAGLFNIDLNTGVLTFASGRNRESHSDFDSNGIYEVTVQVSDGTLTDSQDISVTITDVDEFDVTIPTDSNAAINEVDENVAIGTTVGLTANAFDLDATNNTITYSLTSNPGGLFQIDANTGVVTTAAAIDRETHGALRSITVQAASSDGSSQTQSFNIAINDLDEFNVSVPTDSDIATNEVDENVIVGTTVGLTANAFDLDATNNTITYSLTSNPGGLFQIDANTGVVTTAAAIDRETHGALRSITVQAASSDGSTQTQSFNITINDVDEFNVSVPTDSDAAVNEVDENVIVGSTVGITANAFDLDATNNTITYSLTSNPGGLFQIDANTGVVTTAAAIDRETHGALRSITVQATSSDGSTQTQSFNITIKDLDEFNVTVPTDTDAAANDVDENVIIGTTVGLTANAFDLDATNNTITYSLTSNPGGLFQIDANTGVVTTAAAIDRETHGALRSITAQAASSDGSTQTQSFNITINDLDEFNVTVPTDVDASSNSVAENATVGTAVGITANAFDLDATTNTIAYTLDDDAGGLFAIDGVTGVVTVNGSLDYESATSHNIIVRASSSDGSSNTQSFTINVTNVNESGVTPISDTDASADFVLENVSVGTAVGVTAFADDLDLTDTVSYSLDDDAGGLFAIDSTTGVVTVAGAMDREMAASYNITVRATSTDTSTITRVFTIAIGDIDEFNVTVPTDTDAATNEVDENVIVGTTVGLTANAFDLDATNNTITYSLTSNPGGLFQIDANTGVVTTAAAIDRETHGALRSITVQAASSDGSTQTQSINITINDLDEFNVSVPTDTDAAVNEVDENVIIGSTVGITANAFDLDATNNSITYSLTSNPGGLFQIDANTGVVTTAAAIDRETHGALRSITVQAASSDGSTQTQSFNITINDLDEFNVSVPTDSDAAVNEVDENVIIGSTVGLTANAFDLDATNNTITYSLTSNPGGLFQIDANTGIVTTAAAIDRETHGALRSITVQATSSDGSTQTQSFNITINDVDEFNVSVPTDSDAAVNEVDENVIVGSTVGITANAFDLDATNNTITYSLTSNPGGLFQIDANTGVVTTAAAIDRETHGALRSITVQAASSDGSTQTQSFNITINDLDEFNVSIPTDSDAAVNEVDENVIVGTTVGLTANAFDLDATNNTITYSLTSNPGGLFQIDASTGVVTTAAAIDRETHGALRSITVQAASSDGSTQTQSFNITINDLDEFNVTVPTDSDVAVNEVDENVIIGTTVGLTANAFDLDATNNTITYSLTSNPGGLFQIDANTGIVTTAAAIDRETHGASRLITVQASSSDGSTATQNFTIAINDLDEFNVTLPLDANASSNSVAENATVGTVVGITGFAEDLDATNNTITYTLDDDAGGRFSIDANSGIVTVAGALDYESNTSHSITIRARSTDGSSATQAFTVTVTNVNEGGVGLISDVNATANTVVENSVVGTTVGVTARATDPDSVDTVSYSLDDSASGRFAIDSNTGAVTTAGAIDREMAGSYNVTIRATSSDGSFSTLSLAIAIVDVNEFSIGPISDTDLANNSVDENASIGSSVGVTAEATDNDATNNTVTYSLIDDDGGRFAIDANSGILTVAATIDREIHGPSRSITVRAISADGSYVDQTLIISINDVDEFDVSLPADTDASANFVSENSTLGTAVGIDVDAIDDDATMNAVVYSLANDDGGRFAIDSVSGIVTVAGLIDRELDGPFRTIVVRADSADGSFSTASFQITIGELNDHSPIIISNGGSAVGYVNVSENNIVVTDVDATDRDLPGQPLTYSIAGGADAARFTINSLTGELQLLQTADYESPSDTDRDNTYEVVVRVEDDLGLSDTQALYVSIINVNESPVAVADSYQGTVAQKMVRSAADGLLANDSDIDGDTMTVVLVSGPASGTLLVNADGSFEFTPTPGFSGDMSFRYYVTDGALDSSAVDVILSIASVGPPPVDPIDSSEEDQEENEESDSESNEATTQLRGLALQVVLSQSEQANANFNDVEDYNEVEDANGNRDDSLLTSATSKLNGPTGGISPVGIEENPFRNIGLTNAQLKRLASHPERMFKFDSELSPAQFEYLLESFAKELLLREHSIQLVSGLATAVFVGAATGGALWLAGGSYLAATLYSSLPVWARFDPIFVLQNNQARKLDDDLTLIDLINEEKSVNHETIDENEEAKS